MLDDQFWYCSWSICCFHVRLIYWALCIPRVWHKVNWTNRWVQFGLTSPWNCQIQHESSYHFFYVYQFLATIEKRSRFHLQNATNMVTLIFLRNRKSHRIKMIDDPFSFFCFFCSCAFLHPIRVWVKWVGFYLRSWLWFRPMLCNTFAIHCAHHIISIRLAHMARCFCVFCCELLLWYNLHVYAILNLYNIFAFIFANTIIVVVSFFQAK